jgi:hypothetical protein
MAAAHFRSRHDVGVALPVAIQTRTTPGRPLRRFVLDAVQHAIPELDVGDYRCSPRKFAEPNRSSSWIADSRVHPADFALAVVGANRGVFCD